MNQQTRSFIRILKHPLKFSFFLFFRLPSAFFSGIRVRDVDERKCIVTVPFKWFTKNPFRSTYFACLGMAAEMSTGVLCLIHIYKRMPAVSMLVVKVEGAYFKKATERTFFICEEGELIKRTVEACISSGEAKTVRVKSNGTNKNGELVAEFYFTWSFKSK